MDSYSGKQKIEFCKRLGKNCEELADYFDIPDYLRKQFAQGKEAREIWTWLEQTGKLDQLVEALNFIDRQDIVLEVLNTAKQDQLSEPPKTISTSPYPGLRAFTEDESALFFGRTPEIHALLDILSNNRFLAVIGASGSGKSSLVRAGVLPKLAEKTSGVRWEWLRFTPGETGDDPFMALSVALKPTLEKSGLTPREIATQLQKRGNIDEMAEKYLTQKPATGQLILFIDQFEELFMVEEDYRQRFINLLEKAVQSPHLRIIMTVRADFHEQCLNYAALARLINTGAWHLASPDISALWQMIAEPAKAAGLQFESGLIEQILRDTGTGSGALALMAFALEQLYLACKPSTFLTWDAYNKIGGVNEAIGRHAEDTYNKLDQEAQNAMAEVFAELVTVDPERGVATRKRADFARIGQTKAVLQLIEAFTDARLLVKNEINGTDAKTPAAGREAIIVEVAHEAVLTHWDLLKIWINERFGDFYLLRQVRMEAAEWERNGRLEANLWPHERLQKVYDMQQKLKPQLSDSVCAFIRPEAERLLEKLNNPDLTHQQREHIGVRLAEIGDPRPGVGVDENGLPQFEWCEVPLGRIELEDNNGTFNVAAFLISKYPVTFKQYRAFLEAADGYHDPRFSTYLQHEPEYGNQFRKIDNHPADNASFHDAMAFCRWLSDKRGVEIRLPTEWEWQQAATGGDPKNIYPWGKDFDSLRCNSCESGLGRSTAVGLYPDGRSPVGALDMSGNVWEWCANSYDTPKNTDVSSARRAVRGGSWDGSRRRLLSSHRNFPSVSRDFSVGFRVVCSSPII